MNKKYYLEHIRIVKKAVNRILDDYERNFRKMDLEIIESKRRIKNQQNIIDMLNTKCIK